MTYLSIFLFDARFIFIATTAARLIKLRLLLLQEAAAEAAAEAKAIEDQGAPPKARTRAATRVEEVLPELPRPGPDVYVGLCGVLDSAILEQLGAGGVPLDTAVFLVPPPLPPPSITPIAHDSSHTGHEHGRHEHHNHARHDDHSHTEHPAAHGHEGEHVRQGGEHADPDHGAQHIVGHGAASDHLVWMRPLCLLVDEKESRYIYISPF